ncbi:antibiotic biosynthesis monooxygenase [Geomonas subterranea]|uniref:Antibiotic biosynthesis monooxygenase n=1 Tax=Geomonas subterranea TaxID=2847989 RepID=A0ABX8LE80_9BACT|nr:putative quinol monooxygenase [Geomonas subterranea]QXE89024.1 antibiotic biosynthesis monooxygenase [Geomonas subterranea]QXM08857.1 antibiotic biosynthesis monooxygenase [Geomonas subterranea]
MSKVTIVAKLTAKNDCIEAVKAEVIKMLAPTRQEQGCIEYRLHQDSTDPAVFVFYENWKDQAAFEQHMDSAHFKAYVAALSDKIADKTVHRMTEMG